MVVGGNPELLLIIIPILDVLGDSRKQWRQRHGLVPNKSWSRDWRTED